MSDGRHFCSPINPAFNNYEKHIFLHQTNKFLINKKKF